MPKPKRHAGRPAEKAVTRAQMRALVHLHRWMTKKRYPPTLAELAASMGIGPQSVFALLRQLQAKRYISRVPYKARAVKILARGRRVFNE